MGNQAEEPSERLSSHGAPQASVFRTTRWNIVRLAQGGDPDAAHAGMERLARTYWYPLYAFARRQGQNEQDAQDLTQGFLARLLTGETLQSADPARGRFRSFLLTCFKNFMADERARAQAIKRGGGVEFVPLDPVAAEERLIGESVPLNLEEHYDRDWAQSLMSEALERLRTDSKDAGKEDRFNALYPFLLDDVSEVEAQALCRQLSLTESGLRSALSRLRFRLGEYLWTEVARTVADTADVEAEIRHLLGILEEGNATTRPL